MFTVRNAVRVAIMQVGVIVAGVLGAGVSGKWWTAMFAPTPLPVSIATMMSYGPMALAIPLIWILAVLGLRNRANVSDDAKNAAFWSGVIILGMLSLVVGYAVLSPWFNVDWGIGRGDED